MEHKILKLVLVSFVFVSFVLVSPVSASYTYYRSDSTHYDWASEGWDDWGDDGNIWHDFSISTINGQARLRGYYGGIGGCSWHTQEIGMTFTPTSTGACYFGADWTLDAELYTNTWLFWTGVAQVRMIYRLYQGSTLLEGKVIYSKSFSESNGFLELYVTMSTESDVRFGTTLQANTQYKISVCAEYYLWAPFAGVRGRYTSCTCLDIASMTVSSSPIG